MNATPPLFASLSHRVCCILLIFALTWAFFPLRAQGKDSLPYWQVEFPKTNFAKRAVNIEEIKTTGAHRDAIPPIWSPTFIPAQKAQDLGAHEPVISLRISVYARAYPLRILLWHEIVHDRISDMELLVTYCALNNSSIVFDRKLAGSKNSQAILFGNTGRLRKFDTVMYDYKTETWWQRYTGRAIIGELVGSRLTQVPSRLESFGEFRDRNPKGKVLIPNKPKARHYGSSPYVRMDTSQGGGLELFKLPKSIRPYDRVVAVGSDAWTLNMLRERRVITAKDVVLRWVPGQNSIHDTRIISFGRDVGNVSVQRYNPALLIWQDALYNVPFAYAFKAFSPNGIIYHDIPSTGND